MRDGPFQQPANEHPPGIPPAPAQTERAPAAQDGPEPDCQGFEPQRIIFLRPFIEVLFRFGRCALLNGSKGDVKEFWLIGLALAARATVGQVACDGSSARRLRRPRVAGGLFEVVQDLSGLPKVWDIRKN